MDETVKKPSFYIRYLAAWSISWSAVILLTQVPEICQLAGAIATGSSVSGCTPDSPRQTMPFINAVFQSAFPRVCITAICALFLSVPSLGIQYFLRWILSRIPLLAKGYLRIVVENGILLGFLETVFLGLPFAFFEYKTADFLLAGDDCLYTYTNHYFLLIEIGGIAVSYFVACVIAALFAKRGLSSTASRELPEQLNGGIE